MPNCRKCVIRNLSRFTLYDITLKETPTAILEKPKIYIYIYISDKFRINILTQINFMSSDAW